MNTILIAVSVTSILGLIFGTILGYTSHRFSLNEDPIIEKINELLPQIQCGQCNYPGCRPYAEAISIHDEKIDLCKPGGKIVEQKIAKLLNIDFRIIDNDKDMMNRVQMIAVIDESNCIGCTKCVHYCPVDAIVGAIHTIHTVISSLCTGCNLCITSCPTQCIKLRSIEINKGY